MTQPLRAGAFGRGEAACGTSAIAALGLSGLYSGVDRLTEVLAGWPLAAALTLLLSSLRLLGPAPRVGAGQEPRPLQQPRSVYSGSSAGSRWVAGGHDESVRR
jgi:hypothetical protein